MTFVRREPLRVCETHKLKTCHKLVKVTYNVASILLSVALHKPAL